MEDIVVIVLVVLVVLVALFVSGCLGRGGFRAQEWSMPVPRHGRPTNDV
jgi:hypothetical protein